MSNKLRVERLLKHLQYDEEAITLILSRFTTRKSKDHGDSGSEGDGDDDAGGLRKEARCEAAVLAGLVDKLGEKEQCSGSDEPAPKKQRVESEPSVPFPKLEDRPDLTGERLPPGCSLNVFQGQGSPYVRGTLPGDRKFRGKHTRNVSFEVVASASSSSKRACLTEAAAKAQVIAWLWDWWSSEGSK